MKNWIVKAKPLSAKGGQKHSEYLLDYSHPSHAGTSNIQVLGGDFNKIQNEHDEIVQARLEKNKGGRPVKNMGQSIVFSLPASIRPSPEVWKEVLNNSLDEISKQTGINKEDLSHFAVLHQEPHKKDHMHLLIRQNPNGKYEKKITGKHTIGACKVAFNKTIKAELGLDNKEFKPKNKGIKEKPLWLARKIKKEKEEKRLSELKDDKNKELVYFIEAQNKSLKESSRAENIKKNNEILIQDNKALLNNKEKLEKGILKIKDDFKVFTNDIKKFKNQVDNNSSKEVIEKQAQKTAKQASTVSKASPQTKKIINDTLNTVTASTSQGTCLSCGKSKAMYSNQCASCYAVSDDYNEFENELVKQAKLEKKLSKNKVGQGFVYDPTKSKK